MFRDSPHITVQLNSPKEILKQLETLSFIRMHSTKRIRADGLEIKPTSPVYGVVSVDKYVPLYADKSVHVFLKTALIRRLMP